MIAFSAQKNLHTAEGEIRLDVAFNVAPG